MRKSVAYMVYHVFLGTPGKKESMYSACNIPRKLR